jgi:monoterpene epsilon-lactone hydrolase
VVVLTPPAAHRSVLVVTEQGASTRPQIFHAIGPEDRAAIAAMRAAVRPMKGQVRDSSGRASYDEILARVAPPNGVAFEPDTLGGVPGWWCRPAGNRPAEAILYLHGGWYMMGSATAYRHLAGHIAASAGASAFVPDYRLAPEHPFPSAIRDVEAVYRDLSNRRIERIALAGDSAGGGLALALLALTSAAGAPRGARPVGAVALSPVTDLTLSGASWTSRADADFFFTKAQVESLVAAYVGPADVRDPLASPLCGTFTGLPPVQLIVGDAETLLDDSVRYAEQATAAGVDVRLDIWDGMPHGFLTSVRQLRAADDALSVVGTFLAERLRSVP